TRHWAVVRAQACRYREFSKRTGAMVVVSLHPRMQASQYRFLAEEFGLVVSPWPLRQVLPIADAFCAVFSDTVLWALELGIPTVILGEHYPLPLHRGEPVDIVSRDAEAMEALERNLCDGPWREQRLAELAVRPRRFANRGRALDAQLELLCQPG